MSRTAAQLLPSCGGVILTGESGIGKTTIAKLALEKVAGRFHVEYIRGTAGSAKRPYGALEFLLNGLDEDTLRHPALLLEGLAQVLLDKAGGRRILISVENADWIDPLAAFTLAQLVRAKLVTLLITCREVDAGGGEFVKLGLENHLRRIEVGALDFRSSADLIEQVAGGGVSSLAIQSLWSSARGVPMHLHILTKEQLREGSLRLHNGVWVLAKPLVLSGEVASGALAKLDAFPGQERFVVEILALAGELPLNILGGLVDPSVVDRLEERLVLETKLVRSPVVQLKDRLFADSIRANLPPGRRRSLWEDMMPAVRPSDMTKLSLPHYVLWGLDSGARPDDELLLAAASTANELRDPAAALRIVQVIEHRKGNPRAVVEEARALAALGRWDEADSTLSGMEPLTAADAPEVVAAVLIENLRVSRSVPRDTAAGLDESLRSAISAALHQLPESNQAMLTSRLVLAEAEQLCFEGRYSEIPETVFGMYGNSDLPFSQRVRAGGMTAEAFAMTGRQHESVELSRSVLDELWQDDLPGSVRGEVHFQVFTSLMVSGMFAECLEMLERGSELKAARLGELVGGELARGLVHAYCGRADLALQSLHPAVSQLQVQRPGALLQLAHAATAYVLTLQQETGQAQEHAALARTSDSRGSWIVGRATSYFLLLSRTHHSEEAAAAELLLHAEAELLRGNSGHGLSFLSAAVRMAGKESGARLAEAAQKTDGLLGEMSEHLGNGLFLDDAQLLLKAARLARDAGNTLLYFESAAAAHAAALRSGNRSDIKVARTLENASYRQLHYSNNPDRVLTLLTPFELELARRAAKGTTSAELGRKLNLSTRTVDWHLGRLFDKLHVSGRVELSEIVS